MYNKRLPQFAKLTLGSCALVLAAAFAPSTALAQQAYPGCTISFDITAAGASVPLDLRYKNCGTVIEVVYSTTPSISALSLTLEGAPDSGSGPGAFTTVTATYPIGANPSTTLVSARIRALFAAGVPAYVRVNAGTFTGTGNLRGSIQAMTTITAYNAGSSSVSSDIANGQSATGGALSGRPVTVSGVDGSSNVRPVLTDATGRVETNTTGTVTVSGTVTANSNVDNGQQAAGAALTGRPVAMAGTDSGNVVRVARTNSTGNLDVVGTVAVTGTVTSTSDINNGQQATATPLTGRPVTVSGTDSGGDVRPLRTDTSGQLILSPSGTQSVNVAQIAGTATTVGSGASSAGTQRVIQSTDSISRAASIPAPVTGTITTADGGSTTTAVSNGQSFVTGTPTANSTVQFQIDNSTSGPSTAVTVQVTGTWTGTLHFEASVDSGTTWFQYILVQAGAAQSTFTGNVIGQANSQNLTHVRMRGAVFTSGTATVAFTNVFASSYAPLISNIGGVNINNGQVAAGASLSTSRPVTTSGVDASGNVRTVRTDTNGYQSMIGTVAVSSAITAPNQFPVLVGGINLGSTTLTTLQTDSAGRTIVAGTAGVGATTSGSNPVWVAGNDDNNFARGIRTDDSGRTQIRPYSETTTATGSATVNVTAACDGTANIDLSATGQTLLLTGNSLQRIFVCGFVISQGAANGTVRFTHYDGSSCQNGTAANRFTHQIRVLANDSVTVNSGAWTWFFRGNTSGGLCVDSSTADAGVTINYYRR